MNKYDTNRHAQHARWCFFTWQDDTLTFILEGRIVSFYDVMKFLFYDVTCIGWCHLQLSSADLLDVRLGTSCLFSSRILLCLIQRQRDTWSVEMECLAEAQISRVSFYCPTLWQTKGNSSLNVLVFSFEYCVCTMFCDF